MRAFYTVARRKQTEKSQHIACFYAVQCRPMFLRLMLVPGNSATACLASLVLVDNCPHDISRYDVHVLQHQVRIPSSKQALILEHLSLNIAVIQTLLSSKYAVILGQYFSKEKIFCKLKTCLNIFRSRYILLKCESSRNAFKLNISWKVNWA